MSRRKGIAMMLGRKVYRLDTMVMGRVDNRSLTHIPHPTHMR